MPRVGKTMDRKAALRRVREGLTSDQRRELDEEYARLSAPELKQHLRRVDHDLECHAFEVNRLDRRRAMILAALAKRNGGDSNG